jgi:circadian clock protein KaiC
MSSSLTRGPKASTGISGLDDITDGGFAARRLFLVEGQPGAGKTTLALQFLLEGARVGEKGLYITLSETDEELRDGAASHGWSLGETIEVFELVPPKNLLDERQQQSLLHRTWRNYTADFGGHRTLTAKTGGPRQPFRNQVAVPGD